MFRKLEIAALVTLGLLALSALPLAGQSTSLIPSNGGYLGGSCRTSNGDEDGMNVIFYQVPDTITGTLYFEIYSPGTNSGTNTLDTGNAGAMTTTFTLIGGSGAYSGSNSRAINYALAPEGVGGIAAYQGT